MKVVLLRDARGVGKRGDVREVADGYARNFLIPHGIAVPASEAALRERERSLALAAERRESGRRRALAIRDAIAAAPLVFRMKLGGHGRSFGSVSSADIADALARKGIVIDRRSIRLDQAIKTSGRHDVAIDLGDGVSATAAVEIAPGD